MKTYDVTIAVAGDKTVTVFAENENEARDIVKLVYSKTDLLDFVPDDLTPFIAHIHEAEDFDDDDSEEEDCEDCPPEKKANCCFFRAVKNKE